MQPPTSGSPGKSTDELTDVLNKLLTKIDDMAQSTKKSANSVEIIANVLTDGGPGGSKYIPPANTTLINSTGNSDEDQPIMVPPSAPEEQSDTL